MHRGPVPDKFDARHGASHLRVPRRSIRIRHRLGRRGSVGRDRAHGRRGGHLDVPAGFAAFRRGRVRRRLLCRAPRARFGVCLVLVLSARDGSVHVPHAHHRVGEAADDERGVFGHDGAIEVLVGVREGVKGDRGEDLGRRLGTRYRMSSIASKRGLVRELGTGISLRTTVGGGSASAASFSAFLSAFPASFSPSSRAWPYPCRRRRRRPRPVAALGSALAALLPIALRARFSSSNSSMARISMDSSRLAQRPVLEALKASILPGAPAP